MRIFYSLGITFYSFAIKIAAILGNHKAKLWVDGRKNIIKQYHLAFKNIEEEIFWVHVSSLGEFEQARPFIEKLKTEKVNAKIFLTFFSPSGYEIRKNYAYADIILYLPSDSLSTMKKIVKIVKPKAVFFAKYDFWFNLIHVLHKNNIKIYYFSSIFRKNQYLFKFYGSWFLNQLKKVNHFVVQNKSSYDILKQYGFNNISIAGDTRVDRVIAIVEENKDFTFLKTFSQNADLLIAGSTWEKDELLLAKYLQTNKKIKLIIAPHDVSELRIRSIENLFNEETVRYSRFENGNITQRIIIIDKIGILAYIYKYAKVVYIGNGFGKGIHNILEPVAWGKPVVFGPNYIKFVEAVELVSNEGAFSFSNYNEMHDYINLLLTDDTLYKNAQAKCKDFIEKNKGATSIILKHTI